MKSLSVPLIDLRIQYLSIKDEIDAAIARVLAKGNFVIGEEVEAFEDEWASYCKARFCIAVSSGTDALYLALRCFDRDGADVLTTPFTFFATTAAIFFSGYIPRFIDIDENGNIDITKERVSHIFAMPVHLYGRPAKVTNHNQRVVIEDSCQAHGLPLRGHIACFSFYPTKNLGAYGQSGAIVTNEKEWADKLNQLREYGEKERFIHYDISGNYRMDELQAAILRCKLPHLDDWNQARRGIAFMYRELLGDLEDIILPKDDLYHYYHAYVIRTKDRDNLAAYLKDAGIQTAVRYPVPMHLQPALAYLGYKKGDFPMAERWAEENLNLPIYPEMPESHVEYVAEKIREYYEAGHNKP